MSKITVNGVTVKYRGKRIEQTRGSVVKFTDGSWIDVSSGSINMCGRGSISMNDSGRRETQAEPKVFEANRSRLSVESISTNLKITVAEGPMKAKATGSQEEIDDIDFRIDDDTLVVTDKGTRSRGGGMNISIGGRGSSVSLFSGMIISSGSIIIGGSSNLPLVEISVPEGSAVAASTRGDADINVGDTKGSLWLELRGSGDAKIGVVGDTSIAIAGSAVIGIKEVIGHLKTKIAGSGDVTVDRGVVSNLIVSIAGSGDFSFGGQAENASLSTAGSGDISVNHVTNKPEKHIAGHGEIRVRNW